LKVRAFLVISLSTLLAGVAPASPTGLNVIPTTDIVPLKSFIGALQNGNTSFTGLTFYDNPQYVEQSQWEVENWLEAGVDYTPTPDVSNNVFAFNAKALLLNEDERLPNAAVGIWNVAQGQAPGYYVTLSKTLNYAQEQEERFKAHHRRNRKLLGRRVHVGLMLDGHGIVQPFTGTDLQVSDTLVFQADWVHGSGSAATAGFAYVLPDQRTVINPAIVFSNDTLRFSGFQLNISHQFSR
jgi:hypothetical protein